MLKQLGLSAVLVCTFALAKAQDRQMPTAETRASKMTEWMKTNLNLTADQLSKVQELNMKYAVKMDSLRNSGLEKQDRFAAMKTDSESRDSELKGILTSEQYATYQEKKKEMKGKYKDKVKDKNSGT
jgi:hypothetical protein